MFAHREHNLDPAAGSDLCGPCSSGDGTEYVLSMVVNQRNTLASDEDEEISAWTVSETAVIPTRRKVPHVP